MGARAGVSLRVFGVSWRIDVGCAMSVVESRQIAASEMRSVIMEGGGGGGGGGVGGGGGGVRRTGTSAAGRGKREGVIAGRRA